MSRGCSEPNCDQKHFGRGFCNTHYQRRRIADRRDVPVLGGKKICKECQELKDFSNFGKHAGCRDGFRPECKECTSAYHKVNRPKYAGGVSRKYSLKKNFGITPEQYDQMLISQGGRCKICGGSESASGRWDSNFLCVDHDHVTGEIRGLLCHPCNTGLGFFKDDTGRLEAAINYLKQRGN